MQVQMHMHMQLFHALTPCTQFVHTSAHGQSNVHVHTLTHTHMHTQVHVAHGSVHTWRRHDPYWRSSSSSSSKRSSREVVARAVVWI